MKRTSATWYLVALLLFLGGWVAAVSIASTDWQDLKEATVIPFEPGTEIPVTDRGVAFFTDLPQDRRGGCHSQPVKALTIKSANFDLSTRSGGRTWHLLSSTKEATPGSYAVSCTPRDRSDTVHYGYAELPAFRSANVGNGVGSIATLAAALLAAWTYWGRRTERKLSSYESA